MPHASEPSLVLAAYTVDRATFTERVAAAREAGFDGLSLRPVDLEAALAEGRSFADIRHFLDDNGLFVADLDALTKWSAHHDRTGTGPLPETYDHEGRARTMWQAAAEVGARSVNVVDMGRHPAPIEELAAGFAAICDRAAEFGMLAHLEALGGSAMPTLATAAEVARLAGRDNGGVIFDTWHHFRAGGTAADLDAIAGQIVSMQISDAPAEAEPDMFSETLRRRLLPGEGDADVAGTLAHLDGLGVRVPISVEVMSDRLRSMPAVEAAKLAAEAGRSVLPHR